MPSDGMPVWVTQGLALILLASLSGDDGGVVL